MIDGLLATTDVELREAERRWRETGAARDEGRALALRVRAGQLEPSKLRVAAACGHEGARAALGLDAPPARDVDVEARLRALHEVGGAPALVHLVVATFERLALEVHLPGLPIQGRAIPFDPGLLDWLLARAREWLACPCEAHAFHMPAHLPISEHGLLVDLADLLHWAPQRLGGRVLAGKAAGLVRACASPLRTPGRELLARSCDAVIGRTLPPR